MRKKCGKNDARQAEEAFAVVQPASPTGILTFTITSRGSESEKRERAKILGSKCFLSLQ
jgi:hypothetical protein